MREFPDTTVDAARCPVVIGRGSIEETLKGSLSLAAAGEGGVVFLTGSAGLGKSRLAAGLATTAHSAGMLVLRGRATAVGETLPFRAVSEAFASSFRRSPPPMPPGLDAYGSALRVVLPDWVAGPEADGVPTFRVVEAVVRLLGVLGARQGLLLVLEDLQWAGPETISLVEYLAGNLGGERVLCLCTTRDLPSSEAAVLAERLAASRTGVHLRLPPLAPDDVALMAQHCLDATYLPPALVEELQRWAGGNPFLVEELLTLAIENGALVRRGTEWCQDRPLPDTVPPAFAREVREQLETLGDDVRGALVALAALGSDIDDEVLTNVGPLDAVEMRRALRGAVEAGLLTMVGTGTDSRTEFRNPLVRSAVLSELLAGERVALAQRALVVIEAATPEIAGHRVEQAAQLCEWAGRRNDAARYLAEAAERALREGAAAKAEGLLERARALVDNEGGLRAELDCRLLAALAAGGKAASALEFGNALVETLRGDGAPPSMLTETHCRIARAGLMSGCWPAAEAHLDQARLLAVECADRDALARVDVTAAALAAREGRTSDAEALARGALAITSERTLPDVACAALRVIAGNALPHDVEQAERELRQSLRTAERHGLGLATIEAQTDLALLSLRRTADVTDLAAMRLRAEEAGALGQAATADFHLSCAHLMRAEPDLAFESIQRYLGLSRREGLGVFAPGLAVLASYHALYGEHALVDDLVEPALAAGEDDPTTGAIAIGAGCAMRSLVEEDRERALDELEAADEFARRQEVPTPWWFSDIRVLLLAVEGGDDDGKARQQSESSGFTWVTWRRGFLALADAVALGRSGQKVEAEAAMARGDAALANARWCRHQGLRLVAEAAIRDDWGEPVAWLREALAFFEGVGHRATVMGCKRLLQDAGAAIPRRGRGTAAVPAGLRSSGITSREMDVLYFLIEGASTADVAAKLFLSPRTVKSHVTSLMRKSGTTTRQELVAFAAEHGVELPVPHEAAEVIDLVAEHGRPEFVH